MSDITNITAVIGGIKQAMDIAKFINDSSTTLDKSEMKLKLAELTSSLADLKVNLAEIRVELIEKNAEIASLNEKLQAKKNMVFEKPFYYRSEGSKKDGPFCAQCYDSESKSIRLHEQSKDFWKCMTCESFYDLSPPQDFSRTSDYEYDPFKY